MAWKQAEQPKLRSLGVRASVFFRDIQSFWFDMKLEEYERIVLSPILRERVFMTTLTPHIVLLVQQQACGQVVLHQEKTPAPNEAVFSSSFTMTRKADTASS